MDGASEMNRPSEEPAVTPTGCVMSRLSASGPHRSSLRRRLRPRENAATLLRGTRACLALLAAARRAGARRAGAGRGADGHDLYQQFGAAGNK